MKNTQKIETFSLTSLERRGWTRSLAFKVMPDADIKRNSNGNIRSYSWTAKQVEEGEQDQRFIKHLSKVKSNKDKNKRHAQETLDQYAHSLAYAYQMDLPKVDFQSALDKAGTWIDFLKNCKKYLIAASHVSIDICDHFGCDMDPYEDVALTRERMEAHLILEATCVLSPWQAACFASATQNERLFHSYQYSCHNLQTMSEEFQKLIDSAVERARIQLEDMAEETVQ